MVFLRPIAFQRNRDLTNLFGRSGQQLFGILNQGGDAVAIYEKQKLELGIGISTEAVDATERFNDFQYFKNS